MIAPPSSTVVVETSSLEKDPISVEAASLASQPTTEVQLSGEAEKEKTPEAQGTQ